MSSRERNGRIILAFAVLAFFGVVVVSMVRGEFLLTSALAVAVIGSIGYVLMILGQREG
ncbi:MAG: hypothetical protein ACOC9Y_05945 [Chloroflexota bacterium]